MLGGATDTGVSTSEPGSVTVTAVGGALEVRGPEVAITVGAGECC